MSANRVLKVLRWVIIYLVFLEIFLWLGGQGFLLIQELQNRRNSGSHDVYQIMCLGDSITAEGGENSYPIQLERYLNQMAAGKRQFKVTNRGIPSADSTMLINKVDEFITQDSPDMVVVMMGYNDRTFLESDTGFSKLERALIHIKVYRLAKSLIEKICNRVSSYNLPWNSTLPSKDVKSTQGTEVFEPVPQQYSLMLLYAVQLQEQNEYVKAVAILESLVGLELDKTFIDRAWRELAKCFYALKEYKKMIIVAARHLSKDSFDIQATEQIRNLCKQKLEEHDVIGMLSGLVKMTPNNVPLNGLLAACFADYGYTDQANTYFDRIKGLEVQGQNLVLKNNYNKLHQMLKEHGIKSVFVQYPNREVKILRELFSDIGDYEDVIFVENESNFKDSLDQARYSEFFIDRAGDYFGHGTTYGNYILASRIGENILNYLKIKSPNQMPK